MNPDERATAVDVDKDIEAMSSGAVAPVNVIPVRTDPESLVERFARQQAAEKLAAAQELDRLSNTDYQVPPASTVRSIPEQPVYREQTVPFTPQPKAEAPQPNNNMSSIRARINDMEAKLGLNDAMPTNGKTYSAQSFVDDLGDETFYVQNISNGHVLVTDLDLKIPRGKTVDLLKFCDLETIKKSRDIRVALSANPRSGPMVRRLTPEEYFNKIDQEFKESTKIENFKKLSALRAATGQTADSKLSEPIRPVVYDKLNKLRLSYSDTPHKGITPIEFAQWVQTEDLTKSELDQILAQVDDNELRILVNERKKLLLERS